MTTQPTVAAELPEALTDDQWIDLAERHAMADWDSDNPDGYLNAIKAVCADYAGHVGAMQAQPAGEPAGGVDCIGLALDLESTAKKVESQTAQRAMEAGAHGLRLLAQPAGAQVPEVVLQAIRAAGMHLIRGMNDVYSLIPAMNATPQPPAVAPAPGVPKRREDLVPGVMHCAKCKFQLNRITLCIGDGNVYAGDNKTEPCPNGCGPLWPVTWEQEARSCWKAMEEMHERLVAAAPQPPAEAQEPADEGITREGWVERAMRIYLIAGDTEDEARECAEYQWGEMDMDDLADPYAAAMEDVEGRGPAPQPAVTAGAADALDAARYRVVRRGQHCSVIDGIGDTLMGDALDTAIDATLAAQRATHQGDHR